MQLCKVIWNGNLLLLNNGRLFVNTGAVVLTIMTIELIRKFLIGV
jgi:hypothetical protein